MDLVKAVKCPMMTKSGAGSSALFDGLSCSWDSVVAAFVYLEGWMAS